MYQDFYTVYINTSMGTEMLGQLFKYILLLFLAILVARKLLSDSMYDGFGCNTLLDQYPRKYYNLWRITIFVGFY